MYATISAMLHSGCIRFGLFGNTDPMMEDIVFRAIDELYLLTTTWHKTGKSNKPYTIKFPRRPPPNHPARYGPEWTLIRLGGGDY